MWELTGATVRFDGTVALDAVDLPVAPAETLVVLGPSGCGKSTLLRAMAGLQPLHAGRFLIDGDDATTRPPHERGIGMVFQDPTLFPHRRVGANIEFGLRMQRTAAEERATRVDDLLALVGLAGFADRDPSTLSGGEAQRVALARSLAPSPRLLLLDEPLAGLDRARRDRLVDDLPGVLAAGGTTAVLVTHDHDEAFALADRIAVMDAGRILRIDRPHALYADPRTETVARFLGHTNIVGEGPTRRVLRRDAATVDPAGDLDGTVVASRFRGDHHDIDVATALGRLSFSVLHPARVGEEIRLAIDPERVAPIDDD